MKKVIAIIRSNDKSSRRNRQQMDKINQYISKNGYTVVRYHIEQGVDGKNLNRTEWKKTMQYINQHPNEVSFIITCRYDRILDDFLMTAKLMRRLKPLGVRIFSIEETIPDDDPIHQQVFYREI
jgi:DNA invertase Pin-like site-specific DNA recombinase